MKNRHNKKRNTAFLFEVLVRELTSSIVKKDNSRKQTITDILKECFDKNTSLYKEYQCYEALQPSDVLDTYTAEKLIFRAKKAHEELDTQSIFQEQSRLINRINKEVGPDTFKVFVPNYRSYATISQIFGDKVPLKNRVLLEGEVLTSLTQQKSSATKLDNLDSLTVTSFVKRFNETYGGLLPEQQTLLHKYIFAFGPNEVDFKVYAGAQLQEIKKHMERSLTSPEVADDPVMVENTKKVLELVESFDVSHIDQPRLIKLLKLQKLASEYQNDN